MVKSNVNCSIESEMKQAAQGLNFNFSDCLTFGIKFRAAEIEDSEYPANLLSHRIERLAERLAEANRRIEELEAPKIGDENFVRGRQLGRIPVYPENESLIYPEGHYGN